ncbi:MAG TPA: GNAT family N-acetyltransferase [Micromonosporaceae bacterium]|jgi:predicted acetyltransferase
MLELIAPTTRLRQAWLDAQSEWEPGDTMHGSGSDGWAELRTTDGFAAWVEHLLRMSDESVPTAPDRVHATYWWVVDGDTYLGAITLRHRLNDFLLRAGGHIGYGVRPSARGRGVATWALGQVLGHARAMGLPRVLITCRDANVASARTIEHNGGVLEDIRETEFGPTRRYWVNLRHQGA